MIRNNKDYDGSILFREVLVLSTPWSNEYQKLWRIVDETLEINFAYIDLQEFGKFNHDCCMYSSFA